MQRGADYIIGETFNYLGEAKLALDGINSDLKEQVEWKEVLTILLARPITT